MQINDSGEAALYVWDYFYLSRTPPAGEERLWRKIECATLRARESEPYLRAPCSVGERILHAKLFDPQNPDHMTAVQAYLERASSDAPEFTGWTYAVRTECEKKKRDARGTGTKDAMEEFEP